MVYVDIPGLPKDFNVKYRPSRVSLFPPSYRERAFLRSIHRDVLRQTASVEKDSDEKDDKAKSEGVTTSVQTVESHCYHACPSHPHEEEKPKKHKKTRVSKGCCCKGKAQESDTDKSEDDSDDSQNSNEEDCGSNHCKHKCIKKKSPRCMKKKDSNSKIPDSIRPFLPYPLSSPNADIFWSKNIYQQPFVERPFIHKQDLPGWNLDYKLDAARRADEKYLWNFLAQHEGNNRQSAFQWLADRDNQRQATLANVAKDLADLSFDPKFDRTPLAFPYSQPPGVNYGEYPGANNQRYRGPCCQPGDHGIGQHYNRYQWVKPHDDFNANTRGYHDHHEPRNQQKFKGLEASGRRWDPSGGQNTGSKAWNDHHAYPQYDNHHKASPRETAQLDQWTNNGNGWSTKDSKKEGKWSPRSNAHAEPDNGRYNTGGFGSQNVNGHVLGARGYQFFQDDPLAANDAEEKDRSGSIEW